MNRTTPMRPARAARGLDLCLLIAFAAIPLAGCGGDGGAANGDETAETAAMSEAGGMATAGAMAQAMDAPACEYTASGDELTGRASPPDSSAVELGDGVAKVCYSAPSAREREIMGGLVPFDEPWRLGANEPTTLHLTVPAEIGSVRVDPGKYALYAIPGESEWTVVVNSAPDRWGIPINDEVRAADVGSFTVTPEQTEHVERMTIELSSSGADAAEMSVAWETTRFTFPIRAAGG